MLTIYLKAVDSRGATQAELDAAGITPDQVPHDADGNVWQLASHQAKTLQALRDDEAPIVINTAMTGDGKTLAGRLPLLNDRWSTFAMYPTNALAYDQRAGFNELLTMWQPPAWAGQTIQHRLINAREINDFSFGEGIAASRMSELRSMLDDEDYIFTNPDIFHLILNFVYQDRGIAPDYMPTLVASRYRLYIFDEFHLFGVEQTAAVLIAILFLKQLMPPGQQPRFLFLSATPQKMLTHLAQRAGLIYHEPISGEYVHGKPQSPAGYRRILQEANLTVHSADTLDDWVRDHFNSIIRSFFVDSTSAVKGLIIANSVASAYRVRDILVELCDGLDINIAINTGLTPKADRHSDFDLLVATSTVDVGVDFKINFLVFESRDAASHMQRLGRLGRHSTDRDGRAFGEFVAHAIVPGWVLEGLKDAFVDGDYVSRKKYDDTISELFSPSQQFQDYVYRWAGVQAGQLLHHLNHRTIRTQYEKTRKTLEAQFHDLFSKRSVRKFVYLAKNGHAGIIQSAASFRGSSPFTALIQDPETDSQHIVSYNLLTLLRRAELRAVSKDDLLQEARHLGQNVDALKQTNPLAVYFLIGWNNDYRDIIIELDIKLTEDKLETVIEQNQFRIQCAGIPELSSLNRELETRTLVAFVIRDHDPYDVRRVLRLGYRTEVLAFSGYGLQGTIAFGRDALLVDSVYRRRKAQNALIW